MTASPADTAFLDCLAETLAGTWPAPLPEDPAATALDALEPRDLIETMLATRIIAAHHATVDSYRRAMQPGVSDADAVRLRNSAIAAARSFDTALRTLEKRRAPAEKLSQSDAQGAPPRHPHQAPSAADAPDQDDLAASPRRRSPRPGRRWTTTRSSSSRPSWRNASRSTAGRT